MNRLAWIALGLVLAGFPLVGGDFYVNLGSQIFIAAILTASLNLLVGYGGLVSLGHAAWIGLAAYTSAWLYLRLGLAHWITAPLALVVTTLIAGLFGWIALRATGLGFLMITLALSQVLWGTAYRWAAVTGGDNGLSGLTRPAPFGISIDGPAAFYYFSLTVTILAIWMMARFVNSPFGAVLRGSRDESRRMNALGHNVWLVRWLSFVYSGFWGAVAGLLFVYYHKYIHPTALSLTSSAEVLLGCGADRRRGDRPAPEKLCVGLPRALEHAARCRLRADRDFHAGWGCPRISPLVASVAKAMTPALQISGLRKSFGGLPAMNGVSLEVMPGERRLIIGPNGAGKTTLFNLITGDLAPDAGAIRLFGEEVSRLKPHQRAHRGVARTYQIITLFPKDSLEHNIVLALLGLSSVRWSAFRPLALETGLHEEARRVLGLVGLDQRAVRPIGEVSYGEKRRVEIAMALAQKPRLLLLDEPLAGLSLEERVAVKALIAGIPRNVTVVMIEHDMDTALDLAERITVLHYGSVIVEGTRSEVVADPKTREVYLGN